MIYTLSLKPSKIHILIINPHTALEILGNIVTVRRSSDASEGSATG